MDFEYSLTAIKYKRLLNTSSVHRDTGSICASEMRRCGTVDLVFHYPNSFANDKILGVAFEMEVKISCRLSDGHEESI